MVHPHLNSDRKGDTACRGRRGSRYTGSRQHQYNGRARCVRFHGTLFFTSSLPLSPICPTAVGLVQARSSPNSNTVWYLVLDTYELHICSPRACDLSKRRHPPCMSLTRSLVGRYSMCKDGHRTLLSDRWRDGTHLDFFM